MSLNARVVQSGSQTPGSQAIQGFAMQNANNANQSTVMSVVVDDVKAQIHRRKTDLERYFQDQSVQSTEIEVLGVEKEQLLKVLEKLDPKAAMKTWSIEDFQTAVKTTKREYESKDRVFGGKSQKFFHKIVAKFGAHANLFKMIPQQTNYTSIVTGAATILVSASIQHTETIEDLSRVLSVIDDEAAICTLDNEFFQSESMQRAIAKFFIAVFLLLGDIATWYRSSSWRKMRNSLHEGFRQQFEDALNKIVRLSGDIQRTAQQGANAEVRVIRLGMEELRLQVDDSRVGLTGEFRKIMQTQWQQMQDVLAQQKRSEEQNKLEHQETRRAFMDQFIRLTTSWKEIGQRAMPLLQDEIINIASIHQQQKAIIYHSDQVSQNDPLADLVRLPSTEVQPETSRIKDIVEWCIPLLTYVQSGAGTQTLSDEETPVFFDRRVVIALGEWFRADESKLLYLESPSYITAAAMRIVLAAGGIKPPMPCASFFCLAKEFDDESEVQATEVDPLLGVVYSLIYQILRGLPPLTDQALIKSKDRFANLDGTLASWNSALQLLKDTLNLAPALAIIVLDGLLAFEEDHEYEIKDLIGLFHEQICVEGKVLKVLVTSDRMIYSMMADLAVDEMTILDAGTQQTRGMIPFISGGDLDEDST